MGSTPAPLSALEGIFENLVAILLALGGVTLFIMLLIGGFKYLTSGGDPKMAEGAKKTLTIAIGGFVMLIGSYIILQIIANFTGTGSSITDFVITKP